MDKPRSCEVGGGDWRVIKTGRCTGRQGGDPVATGGVHNFWSLGPRGEDPQGRRKVTSEYRMAELPLYQGGE